MDKPTVTVFIPCYNAERFISNTIESILLQTYQDFEILIIDDGSTDNSVGIIENYAKRDSRIRIMYNNVNRGVAYTRNRGIKEARGKYLATMDADDVAVPTRLEKEVQYLDSHKTVGVVSGYSYLIDEKGKKLGKQKKIKYTANEVRVCMFFSNIIVNSASMYRLDIIRKHKIKYKNDFHGIEDYMFWCMLLNFTDIIVLDEYFVYYRIVQSGLTCTNNRDCSFERIKCIEKVHKYMLESNHIYIKGNKCLLYHPAPFFQNKIIRTVVILVYLMQILIQVRVMRKTYYPELRSHIIYMIKNNELQI